MAYGDYTLGQAPAPTQTNLGGGRAAMQALFGAGALGNNRVNPMLGVLATEGDSQQQMQNAIANMRMQDIQSKLAQEKFSQQQFQDKMKDMQPGLLDFLGLGASAISPISALINRGSGVNNAPGSELDYLNTMLTGLPTGPGGQ